MTIEDEQKKMASTYIRVIVYNPKGKAVYVQYISPKLISLRKLTDKLEDLFADLSSEFIR